MYVRGRYGVEFTPGKPRPEANWLVRVAGVAACIVVIVAVNAVWRHVRARDEQKQTVELPTVEVAGSVAPTSPTNDSPAAAVPPEPSMRKVDYANRPPRVRNLLLRLAEAERRHDAEMAVSTIEQLRSTPGVADLDDTLARRLGVLNMRRLFEARNARWTTEVTVQRGYSATRIAYEHGSTLASLEKLNGGNVNRLRAGQKLKVMNHPRFSLVVTRSARTLDLSLDGKFFKRYYLTGDVSGAVGSYETPERFRSFCAEYGLRLRPEDRAELELLLPKGSAAFIRDL